MDKQTTIAFVLIGLIVIVWLYISTPTVPPGQEKQKTTELQKDSIKASQTPIEEVKVKTGDTVNYGKYFSKPVLPEKIITIENDFAVFEVSNRGGKILKCFLKNFNNWYIKDLSSDASFYEKHVQLLNKGGSPDLAFITSDGKAISTGDLEFTSSLNESKYKVTGNDSLILNYTIKVGDSSRINKAFVFYGDKYDTKFDLELIKMNDLISGDVYDIVWNNGLRFVEENSADESNSANASVYSGDEKVIVDAPRSGEMVEKEFNGKVDWIAIRNKYFTAILWPENSANVEGAYIKGNAVHYNEGGTRKFFTARLKMSLKNVSDDKESFRIFIGPVSYDLLKHYGNNLEKVIEFGSFFGLKFIIRPIAEFAFLPLFKFLHSFIPNYGIVIVIFSLIIKIITHPLTKQSMYSMKKMQLLQPKITELKAKFKDDPQKVNSETMKLYSTYGINPAGGCLPLLLQMPIFIALWGMFQSVVELRQQPFFLWINDLSKPDVIVHLGFTLPIFGISQISGLALLMGVTTFVQQKMTIKDPQQQMLVYVMPVMLTALFMSFPSGLNLYYFLFNLFSIAQQYYINHTHKDMQLVPVKKQKKSGSFMQKLMVAAEEKAKTQQQQKKKK
jgi:YidC/Oxa1 family membrane protein insertase